MQIKFTQDYLRELYEDGKAKNKKYRFQKDIIKRYKNTIDKLRAAENIEDLYQLTSLKYEKLTGNKKGFESVRINDKYRIEFVSATDGFVTICSIIELSNHYK